MPDALCESLDWAGLVALSASHNALTQLPAALGHTLHQLATLDVSHNVLAQLPALPLALVTLNVRHNELSALPDGLAECHQLTSLDVGCNRICSLPRQVGQGHAHRE